MYYIGIASGTKCKFDLNFFNFLESISRSLPETSATPAKTPRINYITNNAI